MTRTPVFLSKHHGLGNDFLVLLDLPGQTPGVSNLTVEQGAALARAACDRHRGIGADGLLIATPGPDDERADVTMRLHNADGSIAEMSGNGIRCFVQAVVDAKYAGPGTVRVATDAGLRVVEAERSDARGLTRIRVGMGDAKVDTIEVPRDAAAVIAAAGGGRVTTVDVGNPHIVIELDPATVDIAAFGPAVEAHFLATSGGINVEVVAKSATDRGVIDMAVWERGVGVTQACGTGATAAALAARRWGIASDIVVVKQPGGMAGVEIDGDATTGETATLVGPSQVIARCIFDWVHDEATDAAGAGA